MSLIFKLRRAASLALPASARGRVADRIFSSIYARSGKQGLLFENIGYAPPFNDIASLPPFDQEPLQASLADAVLYQRPKRHPGGRDRILDIGCGLGGGLLLARHRYPKAEIVGVDRNAVAVETARARVEDDPRLDAVIGDATALPFDDAQFQFVYSIGTARFVGTDAFLAEAYRVLEPGGLLSFQFGASSNAVSDIAKRGAYLASAAGFKPLSIEDISQNIRQSLEDDAPRKAAAARMTPLPFRGYMREKSAMPGSKTYEAYMAGHELACIVCCRKPR